MNQELFEEDTDIETCFVVIVIFPDGVNSLHRKLATLYEAKLWLIDKLFQQKNQGNSLEFPFGFDYEIVTKSGIMNPEQLNLGIM